ncbi:MAG TPA: ABC transporter permease subunit [Candidatus Thermoplasmatota archaeon]|nr:ABC transporter permease subunit [Candidatus Thermoplasmatota archaeon]
MMRAFSSEWVRLMRPGVLLGGGGTIVALTLLITGLMFAMAKPEADITREDLLSGRGTITREMLQTEGGMVLAFALTGQLIGIVSLVIFAQNLGAEYSQGTLKALLAREPRRLRVLFGKALALALLVTLATLAAFVLQSLLAAVLAAAKGLDATPWFTQGSLRDAGLLVLRVILGAWAWGVIGLLLAILLRASAAAVGIGIGYTVVAEPIVSLAFNKAAKYLPGRTLQSFMSWGAPPQPGQPPGLDGPMAATLLLVYMGIMLVVAVTLFQQRDVAG